MTTTTTSPSRVLGPAPAQVWTAASYTGRPVAIATRHGKAAALGPVFAAAGLHLVPVEVDTDRLGTFTGEVPRAGSLFETATAKARLGAEASGLALNLASEGDFAPDASGLVVVQREAVALVDTETGLVLVGRAAGFAPWVRSWTVAAGDDLDALAGQVDLARHRLVVRPEPGRDAAADRRPSGGSLGAGTTTGIDGLTGLREAVRRAAELAPRVRVETDLRSHVCPMRHTVMVEAAEDLLRRLHTTCPGCHRPGFGPEERTGGAPCADCATTTDVPSHVVERCPSCDHVETRRVGPPTADPARCPACNP